MDWMLEYLARMFGFRKPAELEEEVGPEPPRRADPPEELEDAVGPEPPER